MRVKRTAEGNPKAQPSTGRNLPGDSSTASAVRDPAGFSQPNAYPRFSVVACCSPVQGLTR